MIDLEHIFRGVEVFEGDAWVADYTETTKHLPKEYQKGVVISALPITDIPAFHLSDKNGIAFRKEEAIVSACSVARTLLKVVGSCFAS